MDRSGLRTGVAFAPSADERPLAVTAGADDDLGSAGERIADRMTTLLGSWRFILVQSGLLALWIVLNVAAWVGDWDPYPFILLNLALSFQAAFTGPVILMSQNRRAAKDRTTAERDFQVDRDAERRIEDIQGRLDDLAGRQWEALLTVQHQQLLLLHEIRGTGRESAAPAAPGGSPW